MYEYHCNCSRPPRPPAKHRPSPTLPVNETTAPKGIQYNSALVLLMKGSYMSGCFRKFRDVRACWTLEAGDPSLRARIGCYSRYSWMWVQNPLPLTTQIFILQYIGWLFSAPDIAKACDSAMLTDHLHTGPSDLRHRPNKRGRLCSSGIRLHPALRPANQSWIK